MPCQSKIKLKSQACKKVHGKFKLCCKNQTLEKSWIITCPVDVAVSSRICNLYADIQFSWVVIISTVSLVTMEFILAHYITQVIQVTKVTCFGKTFGRFMGEFLTTN